MTPEEIDAEAELELAREQALARKRKQAAETPFEKALRAQPGERFVTVETPTGPAQMTREGVRVPSPSESLEREGYKKLREREERLGAIVSFLSGSPLFGTVAGLRGLATGKGWTSQRLADLAAAETATQQTSPMVTLPQSLPVVGGAKVPVLPTLGGAVATLPAGAARMGGTLLGASLESPLASAAARAGLAGLAGGTQAVTAGPARLVEGEVAPTLKEAAKGAAVNALVGGVAEGAGYGLAKSASALQRAAPEFARSQAVKALTGSGRMMNVLRQKLGVTSEADIQRLGQDVIDTGILTRGGVPQSARGMSEALEGVLAAEGATLGRVRQLADEVVARSGMSPQQRAATIAGASLEDALRMQRADDALAQFQRQGAQVTQPDAVAIAEAYERGVQGAARFGEHTKASVYEPAREKAYDILAQASPRSVPGTVSTRSTTLGGTYEGLWGQTSRMQRSAHAPGDPIGDALAKRELTQSGVRGARGELARQMEMVLPAEEAAAHATAMRNYARAAQLEEVMADTAARAAAKNTIGLGDTQIAQTLGLTGPTAAAALPALSVLRSRANAALAAYSPAVARGAAVGMGVTGAAGRLGAPSAARQSMADPLGPLRQYLALSPEQQKAISIEAFRGAP